jgi:hypothetical protein
MPNFPPLLSFPLDVMPIVVLWLSLMNGLAVVRATNERREKSFILNVFESSDTSVYVFKKLEPFGSITENYGVSAILI